MKIKGPKAIVIVLAILAFLTGIVAFSETYSVLKANDLFDGISRFLDAIYATISLFTLGGPQGVAIQYASHPVIQWMLHAARFLAIASVAGVAWAVFLRLIHSTIEARELMKQTGHIIIMGSNIEGQAFIRSSISAGKKVSVLVASNEEKNTLIDHFGEKLLIHVGETDENTTWQKINANKAESIVLVSEDDRRNIAAMRAIGNLDTSKKSQQPIRIFTQIKSNRLRQELVRQTNSFKSPEGIYFEPFSVPELAARQFFHRRNFFKNAELQNHTGIHWLVFGFNANTSAFLEQFLKVSPFPKFNIPKITIVAPHNAPSINEAKERLRFCREFVELEHIDHDLQYEAVNQDLISKIGANDVSSILISDLQDKDIELALELRGLAQRDGIWKAPIFLGEMQDRPFDNAIFGRMSNFLHDEITQIADLDQICDIKFMTGEIDKLAQHFHTEYLENLGEKRNSLKASHNDWGNLDENYRNSNRRAADHAKSKCEAIGVLGNLDPGNIDGITDVNINEGVLSSLAKLEHDSWQIDRLLCGWKYAGVENEFCRLHPDLVVFEKVRESTKEFDYKQVTALLQTLRSQNHKKSDMRLTKFVGLIGHNQINNAEMNLIKSRLADDILPELKERFSEADLVFLCPGAPGSDLIMAETIGDYIEESRTDNFALNLVKSVRQEELISGYLNKITRNSVWTGKVQSDDDMLLDDNIANTLNNFGGVEKIIDISTNENISARNPFLINANYFATKPDILIAYVDKKKKKHGSAGTKQTVTDAQKNGIEVIQI